ncbi:MAG: hypothetical protein R2910_02505 [Gemmatimonadales bacterium]
MNNNAIVYIFDPALERRRPSEFRRMARALGARGKVLYLIPHNYRTLPVAGDGVVVSPWLARFLAHHPTDHQERTQ